ncbi:MBL fold metallo-hydrolase [Prolixibacteraceae bacterium Z1-6]|uniref:MBL fold metallo-hydrolase n=1 Tax=Draconibacterium aestuarii TaxID=2998507 RepID=A0A9X3F820_9BACT|nr:MBL fold metallo-hydrolase [Prolixibacteraceae bacterium Z1-6]
MYTIITLLVVIFVLVIAITNQNKFGAIPTGERLERIKKSPNFKDGKFQNLSETPQMSEEARFSTMLKELFFSKNKKPENQIPSIKTDLHTLNPNEDALVWFGHSSYLIQIDGKKILVDPVFSGSASPFSFNVKAFDGSNFYQPDDIPEIDYLVITHDHWDHLDYKTVLELKPKINRIITGLGVGAHFEKWGFDTSKIVETDWFEDVLLDDGFRFFCTPARHFSGRGLKHKRSLWVSFLLETPSQKIFIGGDGGYNAHFKEIGKKYGPIDLAILENGQYNKAWKYIHLMPEQVLQAASDLKTKRILPVHSGKFALANHAWNEPLKRITELNKNTIPLVTPQIGELVYLKNTKQTFTKWWLNVDAQ